MQIKNEIAQYSAAMIGLIGGIAHYLRARAKEDMPFNMFLLFTNAFVSAFVAYTIGEALDGNHLDQYTNAIAGFVGFFAYPILDVAEDHIAVIIKSTFKKYRP